MNQDPATGRSVAALMGRRMSLMESHLILRYPASRWNAEPGPSTNRSRSR